MSEKILTPKDVVNLFKYSHDTMGISGNEITKIVIKWLVSFKGEKAKQELFFGSIARVVESQQHGSFVDLPKEDIHQFMYG